MTKQETIKAPSPTGLELLREPFPAHAISKLPRPTQRQTQKLKEEVSNGDFSNGIRCKDCGQWHHKDAIHLDYVGHAALTDRLLDCDPNWNWEPFATNEAGTPVFDQFGGMWIRLTVCGQTRIGYGDAAGKTGGDAIKEAIGDALRNAAMRFGAALDLWHKGDLHADDDGDAANSMKGQRSEPVAELDATAEDIAQASSMLAGSETLDDLKRAFLNLPANIKKNNEVINSGAARKAELEAQLDDKIPY